MYNVEMHLLQGLLIKTPFFLQGTMVFPLLKNQHIQIHTSTFCSILFYKKCKLMYKCL